MDVNICRFFSNLILKFEVRCVTPALRGVLSYSFAKHEKNFLVRSLLVNVNTLKRKSKIAALFFFERKKKKTEANLEDSWVNQKDIVQYIFKYLKPLECFQNQRLVCKFWQYAVETNRYDEWYVVNFEYLEYKYDPTQPFFHKYVRSFKKMKLNITCMINEDKWKYVRDWILNNMKKLNEIEIYWAFRFVVEDLPEDYQSFEFNLIQNSIQTLKTLILPRFQFPNFNFPKLTKIGFTIRSLALCLSASDLEQRLNKVLLNMETVKIVEISKAKREREICICKNIRENFTNHRIIQRWLEFIEPQNGYIPDPGVMHYFYYLETELFHIV